MKILAIETSTSCQSVAIVDGSQILINHSQDAGKAHGTLLLPTIDRSLSEAGLKLGNLDGLACSIGPGSFTGIRVGIATCLGLRAATNLPIALVPTLEALAWNARGMTCAICPVLTNRRGEVYWAIFRWTTDGQFVRELAERVGTPQALADSLTEPTVIFGEGWVAMEQEIRSALAASRLAAGELEGRTGPTAAGVASLGLQRLQRGDVAGDTIAPLYVQRSEAELKYEQGGGISPVVRRQERVSRKIAARLDRGRQRKVRGGLPKTSYGQ